MIIAVVVMTVKTNNLEFFMELYTSHYKVVVFTDPLQGLALVELCGAKLNYKYFIMAIK